MNDETALTVDEFRATLYFDGSPDLSEHALVEAWGREGYGCRSESTEGVFRGFRGGTYVFIGKPAPVETPQIPSFYPAVARARIDWDRTFYVNPKAGYEDVGRATYQADFLFRILADRERPAIAHNEIAATLLGIHQVVPMRAITLHQLDVIVGRANLDDYLSYANSNLDKPSQVASMLAFGAFVTEEDGKTKAWTTGLEYFGQLNLLVENQGLDSLNALNIVFCLGHLIVHGRRFNAGERLTSFDLKAHFVGTERDGRPILDVMVIDYKPVEP